MNSKEKLAQTLQEIEYDSQGDICEKLKEMIEKAKEGYYSDYDSPLTMPCFQLVRDLRQLGLEDVAKRAMNGEFDATEEESDAWFEREGKELALELTKGD